MKGKNNKQTNKQTATWVRKYKKVVLLEMLCICESPRAL